MSLISSPLAAAPRIRVAPPAARNDAAEVIDLMAAYDVAFDDWQIDALEVGCGVDDDGRWAAPTVGLNLARQNGKTLVLIGLALFGAVILGEPTIILSAHQQATSRQLFRTLVGFFDNYDSLRKRVKTVSAALGREQIELRSGTRVAFPARTRQTLRGWTVDRYLADEAQLITDEQWEASKPALSARPNPQVWLAGTAPQMLGDGEVFGRLREAALAGRDRVAWVEYGAEGGCDLDDREQWAAANPGRVEVSAIEAERRELSPSGFSRERLNIWPTDRAERVIDPQLWASRVSAGPLNWAKPTAIGVDATPAPRREVCVAVAWRSDDGCHVELDRAECMDPLDALAHVTDMVARAGRRTPVMVSGGAGALLGPLVAQKVKAQVVTEPEMARAAGGFVDDVEAARLSHDGHPQLAAAVAAARKRPVGPTGAFGWDYRCEGSVLLVAATLARYGAVTARRTGGAMFV